jgi:hypothetical protein
MAAKCPGVVLDFDNNAQGDQRHRRHGNFRRGEQRAWMRKSQRGPEFRGKVVAKIA